MPAFSAQYQFAASFTVFLVALGGLALVVLRQSLTIDRSARLVLGAGFLGVGTSAFLQGSLLVDERGDPTLIALRAAGVAALVLGSRDWRGSPLSRALLWTGCAALVVALPLGVADLDLAAATVSASGGLLLGASLLSASRRAIAARVAASAAGTLLLVVLVLSVALSTLLADSAQDRALAELDDHAVNEAGSVEGRNRQVIRDATITASLLVRLPQDADDPSSPRLLSQLDARGNPNDAQRGAIEAELRRLQDDGTFGDAVAFLYVSEAQQVVAGVGLDTDRLDTIARSPVVTDTLRSSPRRGRATTQVLDTNAFTVGAAPIGLQVATGEVPLGAVVAVAALDDGYLSDRLGDLRVDTLALVGAKGVVARAGAAPGPGALRSLASPVLAGTTRSSVVTRERFAVARPVRESGGGPPVLALVASRSTADVDQTREQLFRTFFVIAFGGTVIALILAAFVGDRIGEGIRRLTTSAEAIQQGRLGVRSGVRSEDEVGVLGATFDSMAASIEEQTAALLEAAERVEAIVAGMGEALLAIDAAARITDFNAAAEELLGVAVDDARGRPLHEVLSIRREDGTDLTSRLGSLGPGRWSELADVALRDGSGVPVALTASALRGPDGEVTGGVIVLRDLRGEREVERMKRTFLSRVGHELRTPLTPLIGYSQLLAGRPVPPDRAQAIYASMLTSAKRLERIVEMLEFFASLDAGRTVLHPETVDVRRLLGDVVDRQAANLNGSHSLARRVARDTPHLEVDGRWLGRAIDELVENAVKFSPGGGRVVVSAGVSEERPGMVEIAVRDSGVGMSPDQVEQAFAEWAQGDESDTRSFGGLGLGLALVQRVAEHHGGEVRCATSPGKGSTFSILLPASPHTPPAPRRRIRRSPAAEGSEP